MIRCYVTNRRQGDLFAHVARAVAAGVEMIQVREKDLGAAELLDLVCKVRDLAAGSSTKVMVNGRLDIALAAGIDGVHLPGDGLPAATVRPYVRTLGISTHSIDEAAFMSREVYVMATNPARIIEVMPVALPYPRNEDSYSAPEFAKATAHLRHLLKQGHRQTVTA